MSNMSYCRFRNTLKDLRDCAEHLEDLDFDPNASGEEAEEMLSREESDAKLALLRLCIDIADEHREDVADEDDCPK